MIFFRRLTDMSFLRPFILLNLMRIGIEWGGFPALGNVDLSNEDILSLTVQLVYKNLLFLVGKVLFGSKCPNDKSTRKITKFFVLFL